MSIVLVERYRRWFAFEQDVQQKTLDSLRAILPKSRASTEGRRATMLLAHIVVTRRVWLFRMGGLADKPKDYFPDDKSLDEIEALAGETRQAWSEYLERLDDADLAYIYDYRRSDGRAYRNSIEDTLTHLFAHSFYHRGQIAALVRAMGGQPAATDFIFWAREAIDEP